MATNYNTTTELISSLKKRGLVPESQSTFEADDFCRVMHEVLLNLISPAMMTVRENYFLEYKDWTLVSGTSRYELPTRAIGAKLKSLFWLNSDGYVRSKLVLTDVEELAQLPWDQMTGEPQYFYFIDNFIEVVPTPSSSVTGSLRGYYFQRRNRLVPTSSVGEITEINAGANSVVINSTPTTFTAAESYDFVKGKPGFQNLAIDQTPSGVAGTTFTFGSLPSGLAVGDFLCLAGQSPVPQVPVEAQPLLSQMTVEIVLRALNDVVGADKAKEAVKPMMEAFLKLVSVRAEDHPKYLGGFDSLFGYVTGRR